MEFTPGGERHYAACVRAADQLLVGLDFDGVLSPIVADPEQAHIHPDAGEALVALAAQVRAVAVVTGRPARQALDLGGLEEVGRAVAEQGRVLYLLGQYGNERWTSAEQRIVSPAPPPGVAALTDELPELLDRAGAGEAWVEEKGLAVAVHARRLPDPEAAYERLLPLLSEAAERHDLVVEPGRAVVEIRAHGMHKGDAVRRLVAEVDAGGVVFGGDDLGDVEAFRAVAELRDGGAAGLRVASRSVPGEPTPLADDADVVVDGPAGVIDLLRRLTADAASK